MDMKKKRLTLDLDPELQRRLKAVAAVKGVSMREYCQTAIDKELARDESSEMVSVPFAIDKLVSLREEIFQGRELPGDSAEFIREARESRAEL
jgi:hypothetical protein